jgi:hypothetical protein
VPDGSVGGAAPNSEGFREQDHSGLVAPDSKSGSPLAPIYYSGAWADELRLQ